MGDKLFNRFVDSFSDNRKPVLSAAEGSAIQNPKWPGIVAIVTDAFRGPTG